MFNKIFFYDNKGTIFHQSGSSMLILGNFFYLVFKVSSICYVTQHSKFCYHSFHQNVTHIINLALAESFSFSASCSHHLVLGSLLICSIHSSFFWRGRFFPPLSLFDQDRSPLPTLLIH